VSKCFDVPRTDFHPPPKVDSRVVRIEPQGQPLETDWDWVEWNSMLKLCFQGKNKTMRSLFGIRAVGARLEAARELVTAQGGGTVKELLPLKDVLLGVLEERSLSQKRANAMTPEDFYDLYSGMHGEGIWFAPSRYAPVQQKLGEEQMHEERTERNLVTREEGIDG
jgi:18S rRNA (adenine1779-N6/adenine1780-N6)-dimethyltransferase